MTDTPMNDAAAPQSVPPAGRAPLRRDLRRFARNKLSVLGAVFILLVLAGGVFAPWIVPFPQHAGAGVNFMDANRAPDAKYWLGTDSVGRDVFSRILFAFRNSLMLGACVVGIAVVIGSAVGMCAGYFGGKVEVVLMRITDIFLAVPSLVMAMAVMGVVSSPSQFVAMVAIALAWWPWHARLVYGIVLSLRHEGYVIAARVLGASPLRIILTELLPNCAPNIFTKASLDMGAVILMGASLSFLGMGAPPPTPDLGTMVAEGALYLPDIWWLSLTSGMAIFLVVLGFNLIADGLRDVFDIVG